MSGRTTSDAQHAEQSASWDSLHASALVLGEAGVLIRGPSGSGKSALTLALLQLAGDRCLFARLIGDDRVLIRAQSGRILAQGAPAIHGLVERRGYGIVGAPTEACAVVRLVVDLLPQGERGPRLPEEENAKITLRGVDLPRLIFGADSAAIERAHALLAVLTTSTTRL